MCPDPIPMKAVAADANPHRTAEAPVRKDRLPRVIKNKKNGT